MLVVVPVVLGVAVAVVQVVDVIAVRHRDVPAAVPVRVLVFVVRLVAFGFALVEVAVVLAVQVSVVDVVDVALVRDRDVPAPRTVFVGVAFVLGVCAGHGRTLTPGAVRGPAKRHPFVPCRISSATVHRPNRAPSEVDGLVGTHVRSSTDLRSKGIPSATSTAGSTEKPTRIAVIALPGWAAFASVLDT
ncbi:hypothetical protein HUW46_09002 [Amycolatopsis sp. CA-230715]|nr:hypothetical protein HUW46_09002 [Amycolatopsis sp. CA-230715]